MFSFINRLFGLEKQPIKLAVRMKKAPTLLRLQHNVARIDVAPQPA